MTDRLSSSDSPRSNTANASAPIHQNEVQSPGAESQFVVKKAIGSKSDTANYLHTTIGRVQGLLNTSSSPDVVLNPPMSKGVSFQIPCSPSNSEVLDELTPLKNYFRQRKETWATPGNSWWKGCRKSMDKGDFWPGCQPNNLPHGLRDGIIMESDDPCENIAGPCDNFPGNKKVVAGMLQAYLRKTKRLFAIMPLGYVDKDELKISDAPKDLPLEIWNQVMINNRLGTDTTQPKSIHFTVCLKEVRFRKHFLLRILNQLEYKKSQAIVYVNRAASVERVCNWLKCQGIDANFLHEGLLMAHTHWILSEFALQKFKVLVMSDDHFDFHSFSNHFAAVGVVVHYELPRVRRLENWILRNKIVTIETDPDGKENPVEIVTFFRSNSLSDSAFKTLIESSSN